MPFEFKTLLTFTEAELIFDEEETRDILKYFFPSRSDAIDKLTVTSSIRSFAQALLVEAVDATYKLGYIRFTWETYMNPSGAISKALAKLARKDATHWFKHVTRKDMLKIKIAASVKNVLGSYFSNVLEEYMRGTTSSLKPKIHVASVNYSNIYRG